MLCWATCIHTGDCITNHTNFIVSRVACVYLTKLEVHISHKQWQHQHSLERGWLERRAEKENMFKSKQKIVISTWNCHTLSNINTPEIIIIIFFFCGGMVASWRQQVTCKVDCILPSLLPAHRSLDCVGRSQLQKLWDLKWSSFDS